MVDWLEDDLKNSNNTDWKIIFFHHPPWFSGKKHGEHIKVNKNFGFYF